MLLLLVSLLACRSVPDELATQRDALRAYHAAEVALEAGRTEAALAHIDEAITLRPRDALLVAWRADVLARTDPKAAADALGSLLKAHPDFHVARFNQAAYLARADKIFDAADILRPLVASGQTTVEDVRADADLAPHLDHPAMAFLPAPELALSTRRLPAKVFRDAEVTWVVEVGGARPLVSGTAEGPVQLVGVVESVQDGATELSYSFRALGEGPIVLGPLEVRADTMEGTVEAATVQAVAPLGADAVPPQTLALGTPRQWAEGLETSSPVRRNDRVWVRTGPTDRVNVTPPQSPEARHSLRESGAPSWVLWVFPAAVERVEVRGAGGVLFDGAPSEASDASER